MTEEQINEKALEAYPIDTKSKIQFLPRDRNESVRKAYIKALREIEKLPKIKGWVARDMDGSTHYFEVKPERSYYGNYWWDRDYIQMSFEKDYFPELRWEDDPIEVELLIRKI